MIFIIYIAQKPWFVQDVFSISMIYLHILRYTLKNIETFTAKVIYDSRITLDIP